MMLRASLGLLAVLMLSSVNPTYADDHEQAMQTAIKAFSGRWQAIGPSGGTSEVSIQPANNRSALVFNGTDYTRLMGWDPVAKKLKIVSFNSDGSHSFSIVTQSGDGPTYRLDITSYDADGVKTESQATLKFTSRDRWEFTLDNDPENRKWVSERLKTQ